MCLDAVLAPFARRAPTPTFFFEGHSDLPDNRFVRITVYRSLAMLDIIACAEVSQSGK